MAAFDDRNEAICALLASYDDPAISRRAKNAASDLRRYAGSGWRFEAELPQLGESFSQRRKLQHQILSLNAGRPIAWRQMLRLALQVVENSEIVIDRPLQ